MKSSIIWEKNVLSFIHLLNKFITFKIVDCLLKNSEKKIYHIINFIILNQNYYINILLYLVVYIT